ncbi:unnamed protein product [Clonostachys rosea f. rosea IK726]|uniref:Histone-lysine N-methyltransferase n=2 Tax=Bionectria ochroleuca TaxID=29856 RepID=A0A0B7K301_BIOOC|nr:unnamed protein product [Clonostachys rosea f. rosea IK726]
MSLSPGSSFSLASALPNDTFSNDASLPNSTPPTTVADSASMNSEPSKLDEITVDVDSEPTTSLPSSAHDDVPMLDAPVQEPVQEGEARDTPTRPRRSKAAPVYNLSKLSGTDGHGKRRANGDVISNRRRRTLIKAGLMEDDGFLEQENARAVNRSKAIGARDSQSASQTSSPRTIRRAKPSPPPRSSSRRATLDVATLNRMIVNTDRRGRKSMDKIVAPPPQKISRELRRLQDTKEFAHVDEQPIVTTVWANGKYVDPKEAESRARKRAKKDEPKNDPKADQEETESPEPVTNTKQRRIKKYLEKGLYSGQDAPMDIYKGLTMTEKKQLSELPELIPSGRVNKIMPSPMFTGLRTLIAGRDFRLPFHVCNPLPPGQPKPDEWRKMTKNRFIGDSKDIWRKSPHYHDMSKCVCKPEDGCGDNCQNRIMLYECDDSNCSVGKENCTNRAFADLTARRNKGGKYRVGVEVIKTSDRGYGVRSNRCFEPNQIIMEYAGEIITEEECERRMNEIYKNNDCYYLMSFDQNMIIDATTGSIARFVNHSCNPNCRMIKWIVAGQPRMALFAGDKPILTGDELTYDYNFDPFSSKNVQKCLCGQPNCRGFLGPKPREVKPAIKTVLKDTVKAGKRKLQEFLGGEEDKAKKPKAKKPTVKAITSTRGALANVGMQLKQGAATALKKTVGSVTSKARGKKTSGASRTSLKGRKSTGTIIKKKLTTTTRVVKAYSKGTPKKQVTSQTSVTAKVTKKTVSEKAPPKSPVKKTPTKKVVTQKTYSSKGSKTSASAKARKVINGLSSPRKAIEITRGIQTITASAE